MINSAAGDLSTTNGWNYSYLLSDFTNEGGRGSDISMVDAGGGAIGLQTAGGGDFAMMAIAQFGSSLDAGSSLFRQLAIGVDGPPASDLPLAFGLDFLLDVNATGGTDMRTAQPFWGVQPGELITDGIFASGRNMAGDDDVAIVRLLLTVWKIGSLT